MTVFVSPLYVVKGNIEQHQSRITDTHWLFKGFVRRYSKLCNDKEKTKQVGLGKNNSFIETLQHTHWTS